MPVIRPVIGPVIGPAIGPMIGRRAAGALLLALPGAAVALSGPLRFRVLREGRPIGTHRVTFADQPEGMLALTEVDIAVRFAGISVFRLTHRFEEVWAGERLLRVASRLERNGRVSELTGRAETGGIALSGGGGSFRLPATAAPLTWWDARRIAGAPLFDNETGRPLRLTWTRSPGPGGGTRWRCRDLDDDAQDSEGGYAADGAWLDWRTRAEDGSSVTYERV